MSSSIALAILGCSIGGLFLTFLTFLQGKRIMTTQVALAAALATIGDQLEKASAEISAEIQTLTDQIANAGGTTPEIDASVARLQAIAQKLDDMNPDVAPPAPAPAPAPGDGGDTTGDGSGATGGTDTP